jgi:CRISPR-associated protein Cas2
MPFTVVVTRNAPERTRGFLASVMLEIAPGVYVSPKMTRGVRERVWNVMLEWSGLLPADGGVMMTFPDRAAPAGHALLLVGFAKADLVDVDGFWLARRAARDVEPEPASPDAGTGEPSKAATEVDPK